MLFCDRPSLVRSIFCAYRPPSYYTFLQSDQHMKQMLHYVMLQVIYCNILLALLIESLLGLTLGTGGTTRHYLR